MSLLLPLATVTLSVTVITAFQLILGSRRISALRDVAPEIAGGLPRVSIVVAARNEARNIREALRSLLDLDYPDYELIVVDDRSEDDTGKILDQMAALHRRLQVIHLNALPPGWLGKNHALWTGSRRATGAYLLFTDADVVMEKSVLTRAIRYLTLHRLDHLVATPSMQMPSVFLEMFGNSFVIFFSLFVRPWKARDPKSRCHIGIGAFNLVRSETYRQVGGHETIRLRPDDDIKLGKIIKKAGGRQDAVYAPEYLSVEWYASVGEVVRGLEKNAFSGADYNIPLVLLGVVVHLFCSVWPFVAIFCTGGAVQGMYLATAAVILLVAADAARFHHSRPWYALGYPLTAALFAYILLRTMLLNLWQGGIYWRGTFYSLKELKRNKV